MVKADLITGVLVGMVLGLVFTVELAPHLALIVILAILFGARIIGSK